MKKYLMKYRVSNIMAMLRNSKAEPLECQDDFNGKLVAITGATSGIGYATAREYASHGANLLTINRNKEKTLNLCEEINRDFNVECDFKIADFAHISDVKKVGEELAKSNLNIDVFIHNAGVYLPERTISDDGNEMVFQVDHLGSFILNYILKDKLKAQKKCRIILVNSEGHRFAILGLKLDDLKWEKRRYSGLKSYGSAKTAQLLTMIKFNDYFQNSGVTINAMHPGSVKTNMGEEDSGLFQKLFIERSYRPIEISSKSLYYLGVSKDIEGVSGKFFNLTYEEEPAPPALDREVADELWDLSIKLGELE
ncbi:MAG: SDR family NAD(P)-dependent oxidoreductase [Promethearchaeota archaeon]|nr:MAG: SDR family NAD(P)-dependent oxidoreductase [Candidatus Lokiarchaeota archaeon]